MLYMYKIYVVYIPNIYIHTIYSLYMYPFPNICIFAPQDTKEN